MRKIKSCRVCYTPRFIEIGSLGDIAISDFTQEPEQGKKFPLTLVYCTVCGLLQLAHDIPRDLLYKKYWYQSHINPVIVQNLEEIFLEIKKILTPKVWIDIGSNDGTLFRFVSGDTMKIGVDPAENILDPYSDIRKVGYWEDVSLDGIKADVITAIACLYDLPNPNAFICKVKDTLSPEGIFVVQLMTLQPMIENNDVGNICHEHIEYYSYRSLVRLFHQNGLEIFRVETNTINGGSYQLFVRHYQEGSIKFQEKEYGVQDLKAFFHRIEDNKTKLLAYLGANLDKKVYGYGASTKANTILQYYGFAEDTTQDTVLLPRDAIAIQAIVDVNPEKNNTYMIGSQIPVVVGNMSLVGDCDILWVFPYGFIDYFKNKEKDYTGKWITTIPEFKIL